MFKCRDIGIVMFVSVSVSVCLCTVCMCVLVQMRILSNIIHDSMFKKCYNVIVLLLMSFLKMES